MNARFKDIKETWKQQQEQAKHDLAVLLCGCDGGIMKQVLKGGNGRWACQVMGLAQVIEPYGSLKEAASTM